MIKHNYLETERLLLTRVQKGDIELIHSLFTEPLVAKFNTIGIPETINVTSKILLPIIKQTLSSNPTNILWVVRLKEDRSFIGDFGLNLKASRYQSGEIYFSLLPQYWNKGFTTEIAKMLVKFCFEELNLHRIEAGCAIDNLASIRVLEKIGMQKEAHTRKLLPLKSGWTDNFGFAVLKEDLY
jgi:RimJ/RimL family protein N-acetyltransferase